MKKRKKKILVIQVRVFAEKIMLQHMQLIAGTSEQDHAKYASPMPVIGVYMALATLVCFLAMLYDVVNVGFRRRKPWLPCGLFTLNSLTLSLISIATKLPMDLTTSMPRSQDQLSKLTSTIFICSCVGFFMPSLGIKSRSECFSNMGALTIFVVTVVVDVCVQMATGIIFLFKVEHLIVLGCMLVLLAVLWSSILDINRSKELVLDHNRHLFEKGLDGKHDLSENMIQRLKWCYIYSFSSNPQFVLCQISHCATVGLLCAVCFIVLSQAVLRTLSHKEFKFIIVQGGVSDYGWSVWMVVVTQILTIILGTLVVAFRWLNLVTHLNLGRYQHWNKLLKIPSYWVYESLFGKLYSLPFKFSKMGFMRSFQMLEDFVGTALYVIQMGVVWTNELVVFSCLLVRELPAWLLRNRNCFSNRLPEVAGVLDSRSTEEEYNEVVYSAENGLKEWILSIGIEDMKKWMDVNKKDTPTKLNDLLCNNAPSKDESLTEQLEIIGFNASSNTPYDYNVSCLSIVILVRMAVVALPSTLTQPLIHALDEAFEILYFIDQKLNLENFNNNVKLLLAKDIWMFRDIQGHWFQKKLIRASLKDYYCKHDPLELSETDHALGIMKELNMKSFGFIILELHTICDFIVNRRDYTSNEEIYDQIKQLFVDMLHKFLSRLPEAIFKDVVESPIEECEERVSLALKFLCRLELLEAYIKWSFPDESELTSLIRISRPEDLTTHQTQEFSSMAEQSSLIVDGDVTSSLTSNSSTILATDTQASSTIAENSGAQILSVVDGNVPDQIQQAGEIIES